MMKTSNKFLIASVLFFLATATSRSNPSDGLSSSSIVQGEAITISSTWSFLDSYAGDSYEYYDDDYEEYYEVYLSDDPVAEFDVEARVVGGSYSEIGRVTATGSQLGDQIEFAMSLSWASPVSDNRDIRLNPVATLSYEDYYY